MKDTELNDGGPAFPRPASEYEPNGLRSDGKIAALPYSGMSLRDWFAGMALSGMCADSNLKDTQHVFAKISYKIADAMLAERNRKEEVKQLKEKYGR